VVVMNAYKGIRNTPPSLLEMCRSFQGTRAQAVVKVVLPSAAGMIFAGLRLGLAMGFVGVVVAELLITPTGIGDLITYHGSVADYPEMFATIASVVLVAAASMAALEQAERRWFRGAAPA
jgi:NitT/TauT family transport system permease protein